MSKFELTFSAREIGAAGVMSHYRRTVTAATYDAARESLYREFDHVLVMAALLGLSDDRA